MAATSEACEGGGVFGGSLVVRVFVMRLGSAIRNPFQRSREGRIRL